MKDSSISWTHHTFNPWLGCARVSEGCTRCYAETMLTRWKRAEWGVNAQRVVTSDAYWKGPLRWNALAASRGVRERVFCASLADVFDAHSGVVEIRAQLWALIAATPHLDWLLLTKRPENIAAMLPADWGAGYPNVWLGTTVEDERVAHRIMALREVPAHVRFLSVEPMIGSLDLHGQLGGIAWVIVGGESGHGARLMEPGWARDAITAARSAGSAVHVKQLGAALSRELGDGLHRDDPAGKDMARWPAALRVREFPMAVACR